MWGEKCSYANPSKKENFIWHNKYYKLIIYYTCVYLLTS